MSNRFDGSNDDFFARFEEMARRETNKITETDTYSADAADEEYSYGSASSYRSETKNKRSVKDDLKNTIILKRLTSKFSRPDKAEEAVEADKVKEAEAEAADIIEEVEAKTADTIEEAEAEAEDTIEEAEAEAEDTIEEAEAEAEDTIEEAEAEEDIKDSAAAAIEKNEIADKIDKADDGVKADKTDWTSYFGRSGNKDKSKEKAQEKKPGKAKKPVASRAKNNKPEKARSKKPHRGKKKNNSRAKAVAASSKFGGSASGKTKRKPIKRESAIKAILKTAVVLVMMAVFAVGIYVGLIFIKAPAINTDNIYSQISQRSIMFDKDGNEVESLYFSNGNRTVIKYKDIPENMVNAVIAIEDHKFWTHHGFNFIRMIGAVKESVLGGGEVSGTSTVTQQLARNVYLAEIKSQRSLSRKITEMYCTIILEKNLTKEQIMEAYLNTIYLGFNSYGVEAAAESYFSKKAGDLNLEQCAALAALPQSPDVYALVYSDYYNTQTSLPKIKKTPTVTYLYNGDMTKERREYIINNMYAEGKITAAQRDEALSKDIQDEIKIGVAADASKISYFTDYALEQLIDDIMEEYGISENDAENMVYTKGLQIYTSLDSKIQNIMEEEFAEDSNFTSISYTRTNEENNLISEKGVVLAYAYENYINDGKFTLNSDEYKMNSDGSMTLFKGKRLNLYSTSTSTGNDISVEFKSLYKKEDYDKFYFIESGALSIPADYKSFDSNDNCVISAQFFTDFPDFFVSDGAGGMSVSEDNFTLKQKVRQPQAAAVIIENKTGEVKGMMGGRGATGKQLYNRAVNPRQPGSSIKPIAVYGPAIQMSYEYHKKNKKLSLDKSDGSDWGKYVTAGSVINDALTKDGNGKVWPKNDDGGYHGPTTVREALQQSLNVCSYKIFKQIDRNMGAEYCLEMLKKVGITTLDDVNDCNPAAISLGGLTYGLTPLEEAAAYETFVNGGVYKTPIFYTKVLDSNNNILFEKHAEETQVYDPGVAWIMTDVLNSVVTKGIGRNAYISSQPSAGKTGTTSNMYDIWFSGFTPYYSMSLWMGNDINMSVSNYSYKAAGFWAAIMGRVCEDLPRASFFERPSNVYQVAGEWYTDGTYSKVTKKKSKTKTKTSTTEEESTTEKTKKTKPTTTKNPTSPPTTKPPTNPPTTAAPTTTAPTTPAPTTTAPPTDPPIDPDD